MALPNREMELWTKLVGLPLDRLAEEPAPAFGFIKRLMRDEKWDYAMAVRVTAEYRRFVLLATLGPVSPSTKVDAAWHLHLTYTRAYNIGLCERTLGRPLDHTPSGSPAESAQYASVYEDTLNRYRAVFGEEPAVDIWPSASAASTARAPGKAKRRKPWVVTALALLAFLGAAFIWHASRLALFAVVTTGLVGIALAMDRTRAEKRGSKDGSCGSAGCGSGDGGGGGDGGGCGGGCGGGGCG